MGNFVIKIALPQKGIYFRKTLHWDNYGNKYFVGNEYKVLVEAETDKSYKIRYIGTDLTSWVGKRKVKFDFLSNSDFCERRQIHIPTSGCKICYNYYCYFAGKEFPNQLLSK